jgi:hypothetical protein
VGRKQNKLRGAKHETGRKNIDGHVRKRQNMWLGRIMISDSLLTTVVDGRMIGKKTTERSRMNADDNRLANDNTTKKSNAKLKNMAQDRKEWQLRNPDLSSDRGLEEA